MKQIFEEMGHSSGDVEALIKGLYMVELESAVSEKSAKLHRKISFYNRAFYFAIISCIPYLYCIWAQISIEKKVIQNKSSIHKLTSFTETNHICGRRNQNTKK